MEALNIQIINPKAKLLLLDLEKMNLIRIEAKPVTKDSVELWKDLKNAAQEVRFHKQGKLKLKTAQELLNRIIIFSILIFMILGFVSCQDETESIKFYYTDNSNYPEKKVSQILAPLGYFTVTIKGGSGIYSVISDNPEVLTAEIENNILKIKAYQIGVANLKISDSDLSSVLCLTINESNSAMGIHYIGSIVEIEGGNAEMEEAIQNEIKTTIEEETSYGIYTQKRDYEGNSEGYLYLYKKNSEKIKGYFTLENTSEYIRLNIEYENGNNDIYQMETNGEKKGLWCKDFLDEYKTKYPELKFTKVEGYKMLSTVYG